MRTISIERGPHLTAGDALWAISAGVLLGTGIVFPPAGGIGFAIGAVGAVRMKGREDENELGEIANFVGNNLSQILNSSSEKENR